MRMVVASVLWCCEGKLLPVRPELTEEFSQRHDEQIWRCFCTIAGVAPEAPSPSSRAVTSLPLVAGGLGLRSATRLRHVAQWASWADTIKMVHERHPEVAESILEAVEGHNQAPSIVAINNSVENLVATGFTPPSWEELSRSTLEAPAPADDEPNQPRAGWQAVASRVVESSFLNVVLPTLSDPDIALLKSQGGPLASAPFVSFPRSRATRLEPQVLKVLFLRRLRLPLPLTARVCRCGRLLDVFGHHRSACIVAGVLGRRGFPLELQRQESAMKQVGEFAQTFLFEIWTWAWSTSSTPGGLRWW